LGVLGPGLRGVVAPLAQQAFVGGFETVLQVAGGMALVFAVVVGGLLGRPLPQTQGQIVGV
ncbi:MFS transporter, partial [Pseudomonas entomophila]|nr:MFS transporter [Pseudomonas entomophila]